MAFVDDPNSSEQSQQVAGSTPLSQGDASGMSEEASGSPTGGSGGESMQSAGQTQQGPRKATKGSGKASSGMYKNIQKYVDKNQPQGQNMAGAVTQNVEKKAASIQNVAQQKKADQQRLIDQNNQMMNQQKQEAANIIYQQTGLESQGYEQPQGQQPAAQPTGEQDQTQRFQDLMSGPQSTAAVGDLNIAEQQNRAKALQQLAASGKTEQGRRNLLKDTFQKQGQYTQGMSGLDQLILSGDDQARQNIVQGTDRTGKELMQNLTGIGQQAQESLAGMKERASGFGQEVGQMATNLETGISGDIDQQYADALAERKALLDPESAEYQAATSAAQKRLDSLGAATGSTADYADYLQQFARSDGGSNIGINDYLQNMRDLSNNGGFDIQEQVPTKDYFGNTTYKTVTRNITGDEAQKYLDQGGGLGMSHYKDRLEVQEYMDALNKNLIGDDADDLYGLKGAQIGSGSTWSKNQNKFQAGNIMNTLRSLQDQYTGLGSSQDIVNRKLSNTFGNQSYDDLVAGKDVNKYETADQQQIDRINALKKLTGQENIITEGQMGDGTYAGADSIKELLKKYGG